MSNAETVSDGRAAGSDGGTACGPARASCTHAASAGSMSRSSSSATAAMALWTWASTAVMRSGSGPAPLRLLTARSSRRRWVSGYDDRFILLDGHARVRALRGLGRDEVEAVLRVLVDEHGELEPHRPASRARWRARPGPYGGPRPPAISSRGAEPRSRPNSRGVAGACFDTASRSRPSTCRMNSSRITYTSSGTASRTSARRSSRRAPCAPRRGASFSLPRAFFASPPRSLSRTSLSRRSPAVLARQSAHARRCRSRWHSSRLHTRCRAPTRGSGWNHRLQMRQGLFRTMSASVPCAHPAGVISGEHRGVNSR